MLGEWLKKMQVIHQDQRKILQAIMHCFHQMFGGAKLPKSRNRINVTSVKRCR